MKRILVVQIVAAVISSGSALAQAASSGQPASSVQPASSLNLDSLSRALIAAINSNEQIDRDSFVTANLADNVSSSDRAATTALLNDLRRDSGGLDLVNIAIGGRGRSITVKPRQYPRLALLHISPSRTQPDKLGVIELLKSWNPKSDDVRWPDKPLPNDRAIVRTIEQNLETLADAGAFSGVVLIGKRDSVLFERGYGWANLEDSIPNSPASRITIASIGKMFTATAIGQLIAAGKLRFDDTLGKVLPEYPNADRARSITVRQLLGHTAGLGEQFSAMSPAVANRPLLFPPGTGWSYSNEGYVVLGAIISKVSGQSYDDYLREHIFGPAGMTHTGNFSADDIVPHRAVGYRHRADDPLGVRPPYGNRTFTGKGGAAGGAYTTARDLWLFSRALIAGRLVPPAIRDTLWTGRSPLPWDQNQKYGYGVIAQSYGDRTVVGHGGGGSGTGIDNEIRFFSDGSYTVIVLANIDPPAASDLAPRLIKFLSSQPVR